jgi:hypothetical protein
MGLCSVHDQHNTQFTPPLLLLRIVVHARSAHPMADCHLARGWGREILLEDEGLGKGRNGGPDSVRKTSAPQSRDSDIFAKFASGWKMDRVCVSAILWT